MAVIINSHLRYWLIGIPIFSLPEKALIDPEPKYYFPDGSTLALSTEQKKFLITWLKNNQTGWSAGISWAPPGQVIVIKPVTLNFHFENLVVFASFPIRADGVLAQLDHPLKPEDRDMLMKTLKVESQDL